MQSSSKLTSNLFFQAELFLLHMFHAASSVGQLKKNNTAKWAHFAHVGAGEMGLSLLDGGEDVEYNGVGFVDMSEIFTTLYTSIFSTISFNRA